MVLIWLDSSWASLVVTLAAITGRVTLQARPSAAFDGTKMYGTFCKRYWLMDVYDSRYHASPYLHREGEDA
jgi:hypothetical protein